MKAFWIFLVCLLSLTLAVETTPALAIANLTDPAKLGR